jgi:DNA processing protein
LEQNALKYWLALLRAPSVGAKGFIKLLHQFSDISSIFAVQNRKHVEKFVPKKTLDSITQPDWKNIERELQWATEPTHHLITLHDQAYPTYLKEIANPPPILYVKGQLNALHNPQIAVVGSRNPSFAGKENAFQFSYELAQNNFTITSGLAKGIDSQGHQGSLKANGQTIAVLGSGINHIYPKENTALAQKIIETGAIVSEFPLDTPPLAKHFPQRNRIISGLCKGVLVIEAAIKSGSLVTARLANEQGREVFAIPGSIQNPLAKGCHYLIREGAKLVETIQDILEEFGLTMQTNTKKTAKHIVFSNAKERKIWNSLGFEPTSTETIVVRNGLTIGEVSSILLHFEMNGLIVSTPMGYLRANTH